MKSATALVNDRTVGTCATILRRCGPMIIGPLACELRSAHHIDLTSGELSMILRMYGPKHKIRTGTSKRFSTPMGTDNKVYYVDENAGTLEWWTK